MDLALYDPDSRLLRPRRPTFRARGRFFYQRRRRAAVRRAARSPDRRDGRRSSTRQSPEPDAHSPFDLVEAGAGNGRLSADILRAARRRDPASLRAHAAAPGRGQRRARAPRSAQTLGDVGGPARRRRATSLPAVVRGRRSSPTSCSTRCRSIRSSCARTGLREVYVDVAGTAGSSTRRRARCRRRRSRDYLERLGVALEPGWRVEINLRARRVDPRRRAAPASRIRDPDRLRPRGARALLGRRTPSGTLTTFARHTMAGPEAPADAAAVARESRRAGHHRARRLHERPRGGRSRRPDDARISRSDVFPAGARRRQTSAELSNARRASSSASR